jgi:hypothetical protein
VTRNRKKRKSGRGQDKERQRKGRGKEESKDAEGQEIEKRGSQAEGGMRKGREQVKMQRET